MTIPRLLFGDNQFFGVNHMSEDKARQQAMRFAEIQSIIDVLDIAHGEGVDVLMCTTHDEMSEIVDTFKGREGYENYTFYPCMPYAHKYANSVGEVGMLETLKRFSPGGLLDTMFSGAMSLATQDPYRVMRLLIDAEMKGFEGANTPVIFLQNVVTDLLLGLKAYDALKAFDEYVREKYGARAGFITMNLPLLVNVLGELGIEQPIICANVNKIGFRMCGGVDEYRDVISSADCTFIAMSVFASGAIPAREALEWVCGLKGLDSIVFGASSATNIRQTKALVDEFWGSDHG